MPRRAVLGFPSNNASLMALLLLILLLNSCDDSTPVQVGDENPNLLANGSFEVDGVPTLEHWHIMDSTSTSLVDVPPPGGGEWSLRLASDWAPVKAYVAQAVPSVADGEVVRLTAQVRAGGQDGGGAIGLLVGPSAVPPAPVELQVTRHDTTWAALAVVETVHREEGEVLWVVLAGLPTEVGARNGFFDLVTLERVGARTAPSQGR